MKTNTNRNYEQEVRDFAKKYEIPLNESEILILVNHLRRGGILLNPRWLKQQSQTKG
jgi:hypothetical protein